MGDLQSDLYRDAERAAQNSPSVLRQRVEDLERQLQQRPTEQQFVNAQVRRFREEGRCPCCGAEDRGQGRLR